MNDMSSVIVPKSDQINADDLIPGPRTITITGVDIKPGTEQPVSIKFDGGDGKVWRPCKSMSRVLVATWGPDAKAYVGRSVTLYRDPEVKWGGLKVGGIRISHMSHLDAPKTMALTETRASRKPFTVKPLENAPAANGIDAARQAIRDAATLDALRTAWSSKAMAPYREQLQGELNQRKADLSFDSPATGGLEAAEAAPQQAEEVAASAQQPVGADEDDF